MASIGWFGGDSREAMRQISEKNCAFMIYIGKENDNFKEVFEDPVIVQLLNNELILCFNMDTASQSFENFKEIFDDVFIPSVYLLERTNTQKYIIKNNYLMDSPIDIQLDLKCRILDAVQSIIKNFADTANNEDKQKYFEYLNDINTKLQVYTNPKSCDVQIDNTITVEKKTNKTARIKIKIPSKEITVVQEFPITALLSDVKTFVINNYSLPGGPLKCIAHRQFLDEDFSKTLDELKLCPASTIYFHIQVVAPSHSMTVLQSWFGVFYSTITKPFNFVLNLLTSFFAIPPPVENPRTSTSPNADNTKKKPAKKPISNIHQLKKIDNPDDDDNNTYNGNSTQQM